MGIQIASRRTQLFGSLCATVFLVNLARVVFAPLVEVFRADPTFQMSAGAAGLLATLAWVGSALPRLPTGYLLTKVPRHRVVLGTGSILSVSAAITATATTRVTLYIGALCMGLASGVYFISANPLVSELFPQRVGRAIGIHGTASQLAAVGAPVFVTVVLAWRDWRAVFWLIAVAAALSTVAFYLTARRATLPDAGAKDRDLLTAFRAQWRLILGGVAVIGTTGFVWNGVFNFYVTYLVEAKSFAEPLARNVLTVVFAAGVPAFWFTGRLADRVSHVRLMFTIIGAFAATLFALTLVSSVWGVVAVSAVIGYVIHSLFPTMDTFVLDSLPDQHRGSAYAVYSATMMLVQSTGSVLVGQVREAGVAFDALFTVYAGGLVVVLALLIVVHAAGRFPTGGAPGVGDG